MTVQQMQFLWIFSCLILMSVGTNIYAKLLLLLLDGCSHECVHLLYEYGPWCFHLFFFCKEFEKTCQSCGYLTLLVLLESLWNKLMSGSKLRFKKKKKHWITEKIWIILITDHLWSCSKLSLQKRHVDYKVCGLMLFFCMQCSKLHVCVSLIHFHQLSDLYYEWMYNGPMYCCMRFG